MIKTPGELASRLSKIKKRNLCSYDTSLEDARKFCIQVMQVVNECQVPSKQGTRIFSEYFKDCIKSIKDVPFKFKQFENETLGRICQSGTLDYAVSVIANLSSGSDFSYDLITEHFSEMNKVWLENQYEIIKNAEEEEAKKAQELAEEAERLKAENERLEKEQAEKLAEERELSKEIYTADRLQRELNKIKKIDLCNEKTTQEEAMKFCKDFMTIVYLCKLAPKEAANVFKEFLVPDCFSGMENVPAKFLQNRDEKYMSIAKMQTVDYPLNIIKSLAEGSEFECKDALEWNAKANKKWLKHNGVELQDKTEESKEQVSQEENTLSLQ